MEKRSRSRPSPSAELDKEFARSSLQIATQDSQLHTFRVWVADSEPRRQRGLMFVKHMDDDAGMLFIYPKAQSIAMWMKNTYVSLDMMFIAGDGRIVHIAENTAPLSTRTIDSGGSVRWVLEVVAGTSRKLGIAAGDRIGLPR